ncbi:MAG: hypothetical protein II559_02195 [Muribaculaceae bacterium]|nr:hypothetical protein [Muribaculaceae bacterium]
MKKFFMISALLAMVSGAFAQNSLSVGTTKVPQGGLGYIEVKYDFAQENYFANYSFDLYLPEGITLNESSIVKGGCHSENHPKNYTIKENDGFYSFAMLSNPTTALTGTSGLLVKLAVNVDSKLALESEHQGAIKKIRFASTGGSTTTFEDVQFTIKVVENRITLDEAVGVTSETPTGEQNVLVKRTIKAGNWSTICLPFAMTGDQVKDAFGDVELADFNGYEKVEDADENIIGINVKFNSVDATAGLQANHPCIIKVGETVNEFSVDGVTIEPEEAPEINKGSKKQPKKIIGTYVAGTVIGESDDPMLYIANNKFYYSKGTAKMKAFRAYFSFFDVLAEFDPEAAKIGIYVDGDATSIDGIGTQRVVEGVYDLSGRKIQLENGDLNKLQKGVYIIDGKKVTIK